MLQTRPPRRARLRALDDTWVPAAAQALRRMFAAGRRRLQAVRELRRIADDQPWLAVSISVVLVAAVLVAAAGNDNSQSPATDRVIVNPEPPPATATLGPVPGASVATYLVRAAYDLRHFGEIAAGRATYAVVDLRARLTPAELETTFDGVTVVRAYEQVPSKLPTQVRSIPLTSIRELRTGLNTAAKVAQATAKSYGVLIQSLHPKRRSDRLVKRKYEQQRQAALVEARALSKPDQCRCLFAVVVQADLTRLESLVRLSQVRVVDPTSPVIPLTGLTVLPLLPEQKTIIPRSAPVSG